MRFPRQNPKASKKPKISLRKHKICCKGIFKKHRNFAKLGKLLPYNADAAPNASEEWDSGCNGTQFIVEIEETPSAPVPNLIFPNSSEEISEFSKNATTNSHGPKIIVRPEEICIVGLVLLLWAGSVMLFINRWGKIRMLEPNAPKFYPEHRSSCPLVDPDAIPTHQRSSLSRLSIGLINNMNGQTYQFTPHGRRSSMIPLTRPRQNSVFVGPSPTQYTMPKKTRKTQSAFDLHSIVIDENAEAV